MSPKSIFDKSFLELLAHTALIARPSGGRFEGARSAGTQGSGIDFVDWRSYATGDSPKDIDWRAFARSGKKFVRLHAREEASNIFILIDTSSSMRFGAPDKYIYACRLAALISAIALNNLDSLRIIAPGKFAPSVSPALLGADNIKNVISLIEKLPAQQCVNIPRTIEQFLDLKAEQGMLIVISDFLGEEFTKLRPALKLLAERGFDGALVQVLSTEELNPKQRGSLKLHETESTDALEIELSEKLQCAYLEELAQLKEKLQEDATNNQMRFLQISTELPLLEVITKQMPEVGITVNT